MGRKLSDVLSWGISSKGLIIQGTHCPDDVSSREQTFGDTSVADTFSCHPSVIDIGSQFTAVTSFLLYCTLIAVTPEFVILEDFNFTRGRLYPRYKSTPARFVPGYLLNLLNVISWTILAKSPPSPPPHGKNYAIHGFFLVCFLFIVVRVSR
jgi:hypothetical protein